MIYRRNKKSSQESKTSVHLTTGFPARAAEELQGKTKRSQHLISICYMKQHHVCIKIQNQKICMGEYLPKSPGNFLKELLVQLLVRFLQQSLHLLYLFSWTRIKIKKLSCHLHNTVEKTKETVKHHYIRSSVTAVHRNKYTILLVAKTINICIVLYPSKMLQSQAQTWIHNYINVTLIQIRHLIKTRSQRI